MKILVLGAGGNLGTAVVDRLVQDGQEVRAFVRRPPPNTPDPHIEVVVGDALNYAAVRQAAEGEDAVVNVIGSGTLRKNTVESDTSRVILQAVSDAGVRRYIGMSAGMVTSVGWLFDHVIRPLVFTNLYREHLEVERLIRSSDLAWTIVRPTRLVNGPARGYREAIGVRPPSHFSMSRADVADFIAKALASPAYVHQTVFLVSH